MPDTCLPLSRCLITFSLGPSLAQLNIRSGRISKKQGPSQASSGTAFYMSPVAIDQCNLRQLPICRCLMIPGKHSKHMSGLL